MKSCVRHCRHVQLILDVVQ